MREKSVRRVMVSFFASFMLLSMVCGLVLFIEPASAATYAPNVDGSGKLGGNEKTVFLEFCMSGAPVNGKHSFYQDVVAFDKALSLATGDRYRCEFYHSEQLGTERDYLESVINGTYKSGMIQSTMIGNYLPDFHVLSFPLVYESWDHFWDVIAPESPIAQDLLAQLESIGLHGVMFGITGEYQFVNGKHPILHPSDFAGVKMRVLESPVLLSTIEAFGGQAINMNWGEVYTSLQQKTIDGVAALNLATYVTKLNEVCKYLTEIHIYDIPNVVIFNLKWWNGLPKEDQDLITRAIQSTFLYVKADYFEQDANTLNLLESEAGMQVIRRNQLDIAEWRAAVQPVYDEYEKQYGGWLKRIADMAPSKKK